MELREGLTFLSPLVFVLAVVALLALTGTGCAAPAVFRHPTAIGQPQLVTVRCNYMGIGPEGCASSASLQCPAGFDVVTRDQVGSLGMVTWLVRCSTPRAPTVGELAGGSR